MSQWCGHPLLLTSHATEVGDTLFHRKGVPQNLKQGRRCIVALGILQLKHPIVFCSFDWEAKSWWHTNHAELGKEIFIVQHIRVQTLSKQLSTFTHCALKLVYKP
jgi:hypothetical protein